MIVEGGEAVLVGWDGVGALRKGVRDKGKRIAMSAGAGRGWIGTRSLQGCHRVV